MCKVYIHPDYTQVVTINKCQAGAGGEAISIYSQTNFKGRMPPPHSHA